MEGNRSRDNGGDRNMPENISPLNGNRWRNNEEPMEENRLRENGGNRNMPENITRVNRSGSYSRTYHCHHGKSQDYHHGWSGNIRRMQDGRSKNRHHPREISNRITHDSGKSSNYRQLKGQHTCVVSTSKRTQCRTTGKEKIVAEQAGFLSPKGSKISQVGDEPSSESPYSESPSSSSPTNLPPLNAKQMKSLKKKIKYKLNRKKRNTFIWSLQSI